MNIFITGAFGFLGRHTAHYFSRKGWQVFGLGHGDWSRNEYRLWGIEEWFPEMVTLTALKRTGLRPDVIVHCAGSGSVAACYGNPYEEYLRTVDGTAQVLEFIRTTSPQSVFIYPSSAAVYGNAAMLPTTETEELNPVSIYGTYKRMSEDICVTYAQNYQIRSARIRFFSVYGCELRKQLLWDACNKISHGETSFWGTGEETRDWLHINDAVRLIECAVSHASAECPVVNGGFGSGVTVRTVLESISDELGATKKIGFNNVTRVGDPFRYQADISKALTWGWTPDIPFNTGIAQYVSWFKELKR